MRGGDYIERSYRDKREKKEWFNKKGYLKWVLI